MIIGTFTPNEHGGYAGSINAAGLNLANVVFEKSEKEKGPAFILSAEHNGQPFEIGAAWEQSGDWGPYLSIRLDGPTFAQPVNANMKLKAHASGLFALTWKRPDTKQDAE